MTTKKRVLSAVAIIAAFLLPRQTLLAEKVYYKNGTEAYEQIIGRDKDSIQVRRAFGDSVVNLERIEKIENDDGSISKYDYNALLKAIEEKVKNGRYDEAADLCGILLESFPKSNEIRYLRATLNHKAGRLAKTVEDYKFIIDNNGASASVFNNLGEIYASGKDNQGAIEMFMRASAKEPDNITALYNLGVAYAAKGDYAEAKNQLNKVIAIDSGDENAKQALRALSGAK